MHILVPCSFTKIAVLYKKLLNSNRKTERKKGNLARWLERIQAPCYQVGMGGKHTRINGRFEASTRSLIGFPFAYRKVRRKITAACTQFGDVTRSACTGARWLVSENANYIYRTFRSQCANQGNTSHETDVAAAGPLAVWVTLLRALNDGPMKEDIFLRNGGRD